MAAAAPPWASLIPFKRVDADPNKDYFLTEKDGPWLIMCRSFAGDTAQQEAHALVLELRQKYKLKAYVHKQHYDYSQLKKDEIPRGIGPKGNPKRMRPANPVSFEEIAVLVGDFNGVEDPRAQSTLKKIKYATPKCLELPNEAVAAKSSQRFGLYREAQRIVSRANLKGLQAESDIQNKGPMRLAFVTRNPLLPEEFFAPKGLDPLIVEMNKEVEHSLLDNRGAYTVRIASFSGQSTMSLKEIENASFGKFKGNRLEEAALKAHKVCEALRKQGIEAYEFHDRTESLVTVGSFDFVSQKTFDGRDEINPAMQAVMQRYQAKETRMPGAPVPVMMPNKVAGVPLDFQPIPMAVPKQSLGSALSRGFWE